MTSVLEAIKATLTNNGSAMNAKTTPAMVQAKLDQANGVLHSLQTRYAPASFKAEETGDPNDVAALAQINSDIFAAEARIRSLGVALGEAERIATMQQRIAAENIYDAQYRAAAQFAGQFKSASQAVGAALLVLNEAYTRMTAAQQKLLAAIPAGCHLDEGSLPSLAKLEKLYAFDVYKLAQKSEQIHVPVSGSLPGWTKPMWGNENLSLADVVQSHADQTMAVIKQTGIERFN